MGPKMTITCRLCGSGSMVAARGMTYRQLWSHENNRQRHTGVVMNAEERDLPPRGLLSAGEGKA
eukprot:12230636-Karenia_brevis.AAC.1